MTPALGSTPYRRVDLSASARLPVFVDLVQSLQESRSHRDVLEAFLDAMRRAFGRQAYISLSTRGLNALAGEYRITQWSDAAHREFVDRAVDPWTGDGAPIQRGGLLGELVRHPDPTLLHDLSIAEDPALGQWIAGQRSLMAVPLMDDGVVTNWALLFSEEPRAFDDTAMEEFVLRSSLIVQSITALRAAQRLRDANRWIEQEVDQIATIQKALLPAEMPAIRGVTLAADYRTYDRAGGDDYTFVCPGATDCNRGDPDRPWCLFVADASGHGPAAAVVMAIVHTMIWMLDRESSGGALGEPARLLRMVNTEISHHGLEGSFVTAMAAVYDPLRRTLRYASAGHPPALVKTRRTDDPCARLDGVGGLPLGIMAESEYVEHETALQPGQTLILYTDGITEAMSPPPPRRAPVVAHGSEDVAEAGWAAAEMRGEMFGVRGIERAIRHCTGEPKCVIGSIFEALRAHEGGLRPADDQTILAMGIE